MKGTKCIMHFKFCPHCGDKLIYKEIGDEGQLPYCNKCNIPFWETFHTSVICAVINEYNEIALLRQDYVSQKNLVCVAGMIKKGETAEETASREIQEELGLDTINLSFIDTYYYHKKDLLMIGYRADVLKKDFKLSKEVNCAEWYSLKDSISYLNQGGIAWQLVSSILEKENNKQNVDIGVRSTAKAIIIDNNKILLNKCYDPFNGNYYSLPGGGQNKYENIYDAVERECLEETGYNITNIKFKGICEEICDNADTRTNYRQYAHKLYHIFTCNPTSNNSTIPTDKDDMQLSCEWIDIDNLEKIRLLPVMLQDNIKNLISSDYPIDMGSIHIPYNHG